MAFLAEDKCLKHCRFLQRISCSQCRQYDSSGHTWHIMDITKCIIVVLHLFWVLACYFGSCQGMLRSKVQSKQQKFHLVPKPYKQIQLFDKFK